MNILFLCGKARMRSPTAAALVHDWPGVSSDYAGLSNDADEKVGAEQILWADLVCVMERRHADRLKQLFGAELRGKRIHVLNVPDRFDYMDPELVRLLESRLRAIPGLR